MVTVLLPTALFVEHSRILHIMIGYTFWIIDRGVEIFYNTFSIIFFPAFEVVIMLKES